MAELRLEHIKKVYDGGVLAVEDFDIDIQDGEFIVIVGPSGCGKSTTLRMIAGLEDITDGHAYLIEQATEDRDEFNKEITNLPSKDRDMAMVFQNYALYAHMTIYQNMAFSLTLRKTDKVEIHKKVMHAAEILDLTTQLNKKPKQLSGGQRQRVALGRAIVRNAKVFLMDEPLSNLDAKLRVQMRSEIIKLHETLNATTIYVTHDQIEAMTMASRIVVMKLGRVQQIGTPIEIYNHPANLFVAGFIGSPAMNFVRCTFDDKVGKAHFTDGHEIDVPASLYKGKGVPSDVILGIRPENIVEAEGEGEFEITVDVAELLGNEYYIHFNFGGASLVSKFPATRIITAGEKLKVNFKKEKIHFFDPTTEKAIY